MPIRKSILITSNHAGKYSVRVYQTATFSQRNPRLKTDVATIYAATTASRRLALHQRADITNVNCHTTLYCTVYTLNNCTHTSYVWIKQQKAMHREKKSNRYLPFSKWSGPESQVVFCLRSSSRHLKTPFALNAKLKWAPYSLAQCLLINQHHNVLIPTLKWR